jgi:hypothetical protein
MSAFCAPRFRRNASKTNDPRVTGDGLSKNKIPYPRSVDIHCSITTAFTNVWIQFVDKNHGLNPLRTLHWIYTNKLTSIYAERVNVVLGIYKQYPGSISSLKQNPGYTSLSRTLPIIVIRYLHSRLSRAWPWSRDCLKENGGDGVLFLVTTDILGNVCIYPGRHLPFQLYLHLQLWMTQ